MTLAHARSLIGSIPVRIEPYTPQRDAAALEALARWALRFTPAVALDPPDGLLMDVTGCERLYGGWMNLAAHVTQAVERLGLHTRVAIGPTSGCAWAAARYGGQKAAVIRDEEVERVIPPLPIAALGVEPGVVEALAEVAVDRIEHLLAIGREQIAERFDPEILARLDNAMGRLDEPLNPVRPRVAPSVERVFAGPVRNLEAVLRATRQLLEELACDLRQRGQAVSRLDLIMDRYEASPLYERMELAAPEPEARHLWLLMYPRVERAYLGHGIERIELKVSRIQTLSSAQANWWGVGEGQVRGRGRKGEANDRSDHDRNLGRLVDQLKARLGMQAVLKARLVDTHVPEAAFYLEPITMAKVRRRETAPLTTIGSRPPILLDRPEPAQVVLLNPDGPLMSLGWRGQWRRLATTIGPEQISGRWWRGPDANRQPPARDYFRVQDEMGRWLWIYREMGGGRWRVHGLWS